MRLRQGDPKTWTWSRSQHADPDAMEVVREIVTEVRAIGDKAVREYTVKFDGVEAAGASEWGQKVAQEVMQSAWEELPQALQDALIAAKERIYHFHCAQRRQEIILAGEDGETLGMVFRPLKRVGVYAPGGRAAYPSTVLVNVIPAKVSGVQEIVLVSPPTRKTGLPHALVLAAAHLAGVKEVYGIGGAQAIAALAYGTVSVKRVDKVVGPGNLYVALAKRLVMGDVGIDSLAGPSEVFIVTDETANPAFVAADMIAQAEHDPEAGAVCVTTWRELPALLNVALEQQLAELPRRDIAQQALGKWGAVVVVDDLDEAMRLVNDSAPEHVELLVQDARRWLTQVKTAGAVFLGPYSPEPVGDYYAGSNHVLPTHGSARFASGLGVDDFLRRMTYVEYTKETLFRHADHITELARSEGLDGHARSVEVRQQDERKVSLEGERD